jgi:hypothetical protein
MTMHSITHLVNLPAKQRGDLDGVGAVCTCGTVIASSLETLARQWGNDHVKYYNAKEGS